MLILHELAVTDLLPNQVKHLSHDTGLEDEDDAYD